MGPYAGVVYNLTLCTVQSRLQHIYHGQRYARVNAMSYARDITIPKYTEQNEGRILKGSLLKLLRDSKI
jgi:hypothetical protein